MTFELEGNLRQFETTTDYFANVDKHIVKMMLNIKMMTTALVNLVKMEFIDDYDTVFQDSFLKTTKVSALQALVNLQSLNNNIKSPIMSINTGTMENDRGNDGRSDEEKHINFILKTTEPKTSDLDRIRTKILLLLLLNSQTYNKRLDSFVSLSDHVVRSFRYSRKPLNISNVLLYQLFLAYVNNSHKKSSKGLYVPGVTPSEFYKYICAIASEFLVLKYGKVLSEERYLRYFDQVFLNKKSMKIIFMTLGYFVCRVLV